MIIVQALNFQLNHSLNHDVSWLLTIADGLSSGKKPYIDFMENNPPLIIWLYSIPVTLQSYTDLHIISLFRLSILMFISAICLLTLKVVKNNDTNINHNISLPFTLMTALCLGLLVLTDFGQREHIVSALLIPYICLVSKPNQNSINCLVYFLAAIAICIKPQYITIIIFIYLPRVILSKNLRSLLSIESGIFMGTGLTYLLLVYVITPEYYSSMIKIAYNTYWAYLQPIEKIYNYQNVLINTGFSTLFLTTYAYSNKKARSICTRFIAAIIGSYIAYIIGGTTWQYHLFPLYCFMTLGVTWALLDTFPNKIKLHKQPISIILLFLLVNIEVPTLFKSSKLLVKHYTPSAMLEILTSNNQKLTRKKGATSFELDLQDIINTYSPDGNSFFFLHNRISPIFPLITHNNYQWPYRYQSPWILPAVIRYENGERQNKYQAIAMEEIKQKYRNDMISSLIENKPNLIILNNNIGAPYFKQRFDFLAFFKEDPRFYTFWQNYYKLDKKIAYNSDFKIFLRHR